MNSKQKSEQRCSWLQKHYFCVFLGRCPSFRTFRLQFNSAHRFSLFFACRKYLLQSLYSDLQSLSADSTPGGGESTPTHQGNEIELDSLPPPTTHTPKSSKSFNAGTTFLHSTVSRVIFSWMFAESCAMFFLLMLQGLDILSPR